MAKRDKEPPVPAWLKHQRKATEHLLQYEETKQDRYLRSAQREIVKAVKSELPPEA